MNVKSTTPASNAGKSTGLILFALIIITAVLLVVIMISDATENRVNASTANAIATRVARCGMNEDTFTKVSPALQAGLDIQCNAPAEVQP